MKIINTKTLAIPEIKVIQYHRFCDHRGYFTETFRRSDFDNNPEMDFIKGNQFVQSNESFSKKGTIRGLHFQWNPFMGKLVRCVYGRMIDLVLDIRKGSPDFGKIIAYDMPAGLDRDFSEWIWVPPGFAHGNIFIEDTLIEYFCTGEYSGGDEAGISPLSDDIDWSLSDKELKKMFDDISETIDLITDKDKDAPTVSQWAEDERSQNFIYNNLK